MPGRRRARLQRRAVADHDIAGLQLGAAQRLAELQGAGAQLRRGPYEIRDLFATAEWTDQKLDITRCEWRDTAGNFAGRASWSRQSSEANFQARSTLALKDFLDAFGFGAFLEGAIFSAPPLVEIFGTANFGSEHPQIKVIGHAAAGEFAYKGVPFSESSAEFSWDGERTLVR